MKRRHRRNYVAKVKEWIRTYREKISRVRDSEIFQTSSDSSNRYSSRLSEDPRTSPYGGRKVPYSLFRTTNLKLLIVLFIGLFCSADSAFAADLEGTLRNLVVVFTGRILPILALGYLGKNIFSHIQGDPNAKGETVRVVVAIACLLGLTGVWNLISSQVR